MRYELIKPAAPEATMPQESSSPEIQQPDFQLPQDTGRHIARTGSRAFESVAGLPGDILQLLSTAVGMGAGVMGGGDPGTDPFGVLGPILKQPKTQEVISDLPLPTSSNLRKYITTPIAEKIGGKGYIDPQSSTEELADDFVGDLSAMLLPIGGKMPFMRTLATAGLGNMAKYAAKEMQLPGLAQEGIKLGTMLGVNFAGPKKIKGIASKLREDAVNTLPKGAEVTAKPLQPTINKLSQLIEKGDLPADWKKKLINLDQQIVNNKIPVQDVWDLSQDINNVFYKQKKPAAFGRAFSEMKNDINNTMKQYGKNNPQFYNSWKDSNSLFTSLKKAEHFTSTFNKYLDVGALSMGGAGALLGFYSPGKYIGTAIGAYGIKKAAEIFPMLINNPTAMKYFSKTMASAATKNVRQMNHFAQKLDQELIKGSPTKTGKSRYELVKPA